MFFARRKEPRDLHFFRRPTYPAKSRIWTLAPNQKSFGSFLQKRTYLRPCVRGEFLRDRLIHRPLERHHQCRQVGKPCPSPVHKLRMVIAVHHSSATPGARR